MKDLAPVFKALGDETRLQIVQLLLGKELCVCDILDAFDKSQPAISHHLKILKQADIVEDRREGKWIYYSVNPEVFQIIDQFVVPFRQQGRERQCCAPQSANKL